MIAYPSAKIEKKAKSAKLSAFYFENNYH